MRHSQESPLTLARAFFGFIMLLALGVLYAGLSLLNVRSAEIRSVSLEQAVLVRANAAAFSFASLLEDDWLHLLDAARTFPTDDERDIRTALDTLVGPGRRVSWAGLTDTDGVVVVASDGLLAGADVSTRPWFQEGLSGAYAGDVHDAVLLNKLLGGSEDEPIRFVDFSTPVFTPEGDLAGVLAMHLDADWLQSHLTRLARSLDIDLYLISADGTVAMASVDTSPGALDLMVMRAAASGAQVARSEVWPDGGTYFSTAVPKVQVGSMPPFGWRLVARIDADAFGAVQSDLSRDMIKVLLVALGAMLAGCWLFHRLFLRPFALLGGNAQAIAEGDSVYPLEERTTRESAMLSAAIAQLQSRMR